MAILDAINTIKSAIEAIKDQIEDHLDNYYHIGKCLEDIDNAIDSIDLAVGDLLDEQRKLEDEIRSLEDEREEFDIRDLSDDALIDEIEGRGYDVNETVNLSLYDKLKQEALQELSENITIGQIEALLEIGDNLDITLEIGLTYPSHVLKEHSLLNDVWY